MYNTLKTHGVDNRKLISQTLSPHTTLTRGVDLDPKIRWDLDTGSTTIETLAETIQKEIEEGSMIDENHVDKIGFLHHIHTRITALGFRCQE
jgi:hypothetical protein